ncbi:MAG: helix-turn-helix domain-containing protein [Micavibrio sp.]|nr:helix-turn-helix domain-containing protein [Micavibrio sp.]
MDDNLSKIMAFDLPPALLAALQQHFGKAGWQIAPTAENADLVLQAENAALRAVPPAVPVMTLDLGKKQRLGALLRQIRQILEEPSLYLEPFTIGPYIFEPQEKVLKRQGSETEGDEISLTDKEVDILVFLARQQGKPIGREALLQQVWRYQQGVDTHTLETHIYRLRQKIEASADAPTLLVTDDNGYSLIL